MMQGGLFSVTLSVTWDLHPKYPRFHEACRLPVFGLSSGEKFQASDRLPHRAGYHRRGLSSSPVLKAASFAGGVMGELYFFNTEQTGRFAYFSDETGEICVSLSVRFPPGFRGGF